MTALLAPVLDQLIQLAGLAVLSLGGWAIRLGAERLRLSNDAAVREYLQRGLELAVDYGRSEARRRLLSANAQGGAVQSAAALSIDLAHGYVQQHYPDAIKRFGLDDEALDRMIRARLPAPSTASALG